MDRTSSRACIMVGFGINSVEPTRSSTGKLVIQGIPKLI